MTAWHSLYLPSADSLTQTLQSSLKQSGYTLYDPFGLMPITKAYTHTVKAFVSPPRNGWTRLLLAPDLPPPDVLFTSLVLAVSLIDSEAIIRTYQDGTEVDLLSALIPYLTTSPEALKSALSRPLLDNPPQSKNDMPFNVLGGDVKAMAENVNVNQAQKMFNKMAGKLLKGEQKDWARDLLNSTVDWGSAGGRRIEALMACLPIPHWREPDYVALRDAYALHNRRRRSPNATLYPGDQDAMDAVPDALDYTPLFAGRNDE